MFTLSLPIVKLNQTKALKLGLLQPCGCFINCTCTVELFLKGKL